MNQITALFEKACLVGVSLIGIAWILNLPGLLGYSLIAAEWIGPMLALAIAAVFMRKPYAENAGMFEVALGAVSIASWLWMSANYSNWIVDISGATASKTLPAVLALVLLMEALRKIAGLPISILVWTLIAYGLLGRFLPPPLQADSLSFGQFALYLYADSNGVPGRVMVVVGTLVLAFIVLGRIMEHGGAIRFFTDLALSVMGGRRGGPAKVAVLASSVFGSINGTAVGNIMSTGIVTIPLMKRSGFRPEFAAAIEAVASNGGQFAPPVMGAAAFLIAEFLQVSYSEVVLAALVPALLYYVCLFLQVDAIASRFGLHGLPRAELPKMKPLLRNGWPFFLPLMLLLWLLFFRNMEPAWAALAAAGFLLVLATIHNKRLPRVSELWQILLGAGESMLPILLIGGGAGIVIGVMNVTGLGFSLSLALSQIGQSAGLLPMLLVTGAIAVVLGMGMPTTAIYVVLSVVLAPSLVEMGISPMAAHLFIFYFGLLSFLTPPVAVASYVAAGLAGSNMWSTSWEGVKLAAMAYLLPVLWCFNPALIFDGSWPEIAYASLTALGAALLMAQGLQGGISVPVPRQLARIILVGLAVLAGSSTIWLGSTSSLNLVVALVCGLAYFWLGRASKSDSA